jgi:hypothetical protein
VSVCTYLLPIRRARFEKNHALEFANYFKTLASSGCEVLVIDGSPAGVFAEHDKLWRDFARHEPVDSRFEFLNDKVNGVHTGVRIASHGKIILADDDIRYTLADLEGICALLDDYEVVRPQNYFGLLDRPWVLTESARMLINRATLPTADYPGTCGFRREVFLTTGEYDGDVLFDNEELIRHFALQGARIAYANDFFVAKQAPVLRKWLEQRPRQAYEDFGLRFKTMLFASLLPIAATLLFLSAKWFLMFALAAALLSILLAFAGWLRGAARRYFAFYACLFAPLWILERTLSTYWAFYWFLSRGGYPFGERLLSKGIGRDWFEGGRIAAKMAARPHT